MKNLVIILAMPFMVYGWLLLFCTMIVLTTTVSFYDCTTSPVFWILYFVFTGGAYGIREDIRATKRRKAEFERLR